MDGGGGGIGPGGTLASFAGGGGCACTTASEATPLDALPALLTCALPVLLRQNRRRR
jgi:MYXO-CTERM domain-containing protein